MLEQINTVLGAVATKDIVPVLTHVHITPDGVQGSNGRISIHYPGQTPVDRPVCIPGRKLQQALKRGKEPKWSLGEQNLTLTAGKLRVRLPINSAPFPVTEPSASALYTLRAPDDFIDDLRTLRPFVAQDGSKPWACGILVKGYALYATNNVILVRLGWKGLDGAGLNGANIPMDAVDEIVRLHKAGHTPTGMRMDDKSLTVEFDTGVWLRTTLLPNDWPDVDAMVLSEPAGPAYRDVLPDLREGVDAVVPFSADERAPVIELGDHGMRTREGDVQAELSLEGLPEGAYRAEVLALVLTVADGVYFEDYPKPVHFVASNLHGIFAGVRA